MFRMLKREEGKEHEINRWLRYKLSFLGLGDAGKWLWLPESHSSLVEQEELVLHIIFLSFPKQAFSPISPSNRSLPQRWQ